MPMAFTVFRRRLRGFICGGSVHFLFRYYIVLYSTLQLFRKPNRSLTVANDKFWVFARLVSLQSRESSDR